MFLFYMVRAMGAGDVKLMAGIGALVGPNQAVGVLLATAIFGGSSRNCLCSLSPPHDIDP